MKASLKINGTIRVIDADPATPLLWILRDHVGFTGTKYGCGVGQCGACTVHLNGDATRSFQIRFDAVDGRHITTIEGLSRDGGHPLQRAFVEMNVPQCGYCVSGMIMAASALLKEKPNPTDEDIDASVSNICRCGSYPRVRAAIHKAAKAG